MRALLLTREYPPHVYGGAGVHVEHLARELARLVEVEVYAFGDHEAAAGPPPVRGFPYGRPPIAGHPQKVGGALAALQTCLDFNARPPAADVVHCHTWYTHFGGVLARLAYGLPLVVTVHSLEPARPWKREQLGRGYDVSLWVERTALRSADAVIAVSEHDRRQIGELFDVAPERLHVVPNGIDVEVYRPTRDPEALRRRGIDPDRPYVFCLGRITRQKGMEHFLRAAADLDPGAQVVLCASSPDTPEIGAEVERLVASLRRRRDGVVWIREVVPRSEAIALYSGAAVFCCPSIYEPFGIINLEAMACRTPVVGSAVGGIREVVVPEQTGLLVPFAPAAADDARPADPAGFARDLAAAMNRLLGDGELRRRFGEAGRRRVTERYGWPAVAARVAEIYRRVAAGRREET